MHLGRPSRASAESERRRRFTLAAAQAAHDLGPAAVTVGSICRLSGEAQTTFRCLYDSAEDCLGQGVEEAGERVLRPVRETDGRGEWLVEVQSAVAGFYASVSLEPLMAELLLVHSYRIASRRPHPAMLAAAEDLCRLMRPGRSAGSDPDPALPPITEEFSAGAVLWAAIRSIDRGETDRLGAETAAVVHLIAAIYLGPGEAARLGAVDREAAES
jgi:AcrR family transcriptional regulator